MAAELSGAASRCLIHIEDDVVGGGEADLEADRAALLELGQQVHRLVEAKRQSRPAGRETLDRDPGETPDLPGGVFEADELREVCEGADIDLHVAREQA